MAKPYVPYEGPIVTREQARITGLTRFFTGKPCKHHHLSERTTCNGGCIQCNGEAITALYYAETPAKREARQVKGAVWKDANRDKVREGGRAYSKAHREQSNAWKAANREKVREGSRDYYERTRDQRKAYHAARYVADPEKIKAVCTRRRARLLNAEGFYTAADVRRIGGMQEWKCHWCGKLTKQGYHVDHIVPLSKGGSNWPSNIAITCARCNLQKSAIDPLIFARRLGRLV